MIDRTQPSAAAGTGLSRDLESRRSAGLAAVVCLVLAGLFVQPAFAKEPSTNMLFKQGQAAEAKQDYDTAFEDFQKAFTRDPKDMRYETAFYRVRISASSAHVTQGRKLLDSGDTQGALAEFLHAAEIDPGNEAATQAIARVREKTGQATPASENAIPELESEQAELETIGAPATLKPISNDPLTLHYTEDTKLVYQAIGQRIAEGYPEFQHIHAGLAKG